MTVTREELVDLALEVTGMTRARWNILSETLKDDAAMNRIMRDDWFRKPRDSEEAIREYYRESDVWFLNTFSHGAGTLLQMSEGAPVLLSPWQKAFTVGFPIHSGSILDYGGGFLNDTGPLVLAGYRIVLAEVRGPVTEFLKRYVGLAGLQSHVGVVEVDADFPIKDTYHGVVCFETLEHILRPADLARHLTEQLVHGGPFAFSVSFGDTPHAPYHIAKNAQLGNGRIWADKLMEMGLTPYWEDERINHFKIWRRA